MFDVQIVVSILQEDSDFEDISEALHRLFYDDITENLNGDNTENLNISETTRAETGNANKTSDSSPVEEGNIISMYDCYFQNQT